MYVQCPMRIAKIIWQADIKVNEVHFAKENFKINKLYSFEGLPWWLSGKESTCNAGDVASVPGLGGSPGDGHGNPL